MIAAVADCTAPDLRGPVLDDGQQRPAPQPRLAPRRAGLAVRRREGDRDPRAPATRSRRTSAAAASSWSASRAATAASSTSTSGRRSATFDTFGASSPAVTGVTRPDRPRDREPHHVAQGHPPARLDARHLVPLGRPAGRRQDDDRPRLEAVDHGRLVERRAASSSASASPTTRRPRATSRRRPRAATSTLTWSPATDDTAVTGLRGPPRRHAARDDRRAARPPGPTPASAAAARPTPTP